VDLDCIKSNLLAVKKMVGPGIMVMPAVKANAYGHGIAASCIALEKAGADYLGVGSMDDAVSLREHGVSVPLLIFAGNMVGEVADLYVAHNLIPTIVSREQAESISGAAKKPHPVFVKMETGRGRLGVNAEECADFVGDIAGLPNIRIEGLYSHMSCADWPDRELEYSMWQYERFLGAARKLEERGMSIPFRQLANTPGSIAYPGIRMTGVCPGRAIWGASPLEKRPEHPDLKTAIRAWKSRLVQVKEVTGGKFGPDFATIRLDRPKRIGVLAGGLSDGISLKQARGGEVLVRGRRVPVCSPVSLEHTTVDLTDCPEAEQGDEAVIMGKQGGEEITRADLMKLWGRNLMEFWTGIPSGLTRVYYEEGTVRYIGRGERLETLG
jgi:alanine racemase